MMSRVVLMQKGSKELVLMILIASCCKELLDLTDGLNMFFHCQLKHTIFQILSKAKRSNTKQFFHYLMSFDSLHTPCS